MRRAPSPRPHTTTLRVAARAAARSRRRALAAMASHDGAETCALPPRAGDADQERIVDLGKQLIKR